MTTFSAQVSTSLGGAALQHHQDAVAAEAAAQIGGRQLRAQQLGQLRHEILAGDHADGVLDVDEPVGLQVGELAHAALHVLRRALAHRRNEVALLQEPRGGVVLDRLGELYLQIVVLLLQRRDGDAHGGLVLVVRARQRQFERERGAVREQRLHLQSVIATICPAGMRPARL